MGALRNFLRARYLLVAGLIAFALAMKVLVPAGYMLNQAGAGPLLAICPNANPGMKLQQKPDAHAHHASHHASHHAGDHAVDAGHHMAGMPYDAGHKGDEHGGHASDNTCPYSLMPIATLSGADGVQLAIALVFILALGFASVVVPRLAAIPYLRPPLRGPPELLG